MWMMKVFAGLAVLVMAPFACAQGALPWGQALSVPALDAMPNVALYYVASYSWVGTHTDYDMARQAADAFLKSNPETPTYLVLGPGGYQTCDDVPLPAVAKGGGETATVSIIGYGSNVSSIMKRAGCGTASSTLSVSGTSVGAVEGATFQGFTVNANHLDPAACGFYGMEDSMVLDVACGNAVPGADHEMEFGAVVAGNAGQDAGLNLYNLKAFDTVGTGKGALITPVWNGTALTSGTLVSGGTKAYTQQYARVQIIGANVSTCSSLPTATVQVASTATTSFSNLPTTNYGEITGITVTNAGVCASTDQLYLLVQDGVPVTYGMKFTNLNMSHAWNLETTAAAAYAEAWMPASQNNTIFGEHAYTNQTIQIGEYGNANKHTSAFFDGAGEYGAEIRGRSGRFVDSIFSWDGSSYLGSSGYLVDGAAGSYAGWTVGNSQCTDSIGDFVSVMTGQGVLQPGAAPPAGVSLADIEACDGSLVVNWPTLVGSY
jgi:hypothetical protein